MDTSENMEYLEDSTVLPELSFDDFLDPSPVKKNNKAYEEDEVMEFDDDINSRTDDTLNTPGPKKPPTLQRNTNTTASITGTLKTATPVRTQAVKLTNVVKNNNGTTTAPVLLNSKNILPKTSTQLSNNSIKLTPKSVANTATTTNLSLAGKTAVRTSNGKIIYIQKTPSATNLKASSTSNTGKPQTSTANNSKTMTIQVLRTADGSYVPIKSTSAGANGKNTTLTLSPTSLAGKKIITSAGGHVVIKGAFKSTDTIATSATNAKTFTTTAITSAKTIVKPTTPTSVVTSDSSKPKPIVVHAAGGKKLIVSSQNIVKLSPKPQTINTTAGTTGTVATTSTSGGAAQIHAIPIPGKIGVQYLRVLPNTKVATKTINTTSAENSTTSTVGTILKTGNTTNQPVKILNSLPQKFTVVQKGGTTKLLVTQKKDTTTNSGGEVKGQKTIVTVPTIKSLNDDKNKGQQLQQQEQPQQLLNKSAQSNNNNSNQTIVRKHKISEINTEIQRITNSSDNVGQPEVKKTVLNNRVVVISSNSQPKILNSSIQQPGRITATLTIPAQTKTVTTSGGSMVQTTNVTQSGNKLYTIIKPSSSSSQEQKPNTKVYSVLKTNNQMASTSIAASSASTATTVSAAQMSSSAAATYKPLLNKHNLVQPQQHKFLQQQQQDQHFSNQRDPVDSLNARPITSKYVLPIKIKEEPTEANSITNGNATGLKLSALNNNMPSERDDVVDTMDSMVGGVRRKHCNCSKSQCLKLYCDCFANGEFCQDCTCKDCLNNLENEDERQKAIKSCLERNPNAFKPKITSSKDQSDMRLHNKGCNCKRSGCLKNYCECYEAKIPCSSNCKCVGCRNVEDRPDLDMDPIDMDHLDNKIFSMVSGETSTMLPQKRGVEKFQGIHTKVDKPSKDNIKSAGNMDYKSGGAVSPTLESQQCNFITQEVIDATIQCMLTQADECEKNNLPAYQTEKLVMEELGRCLVEIIDFSIRNTENSYSQD